uniref:threonine--tRNA ligase n=1 Tax=Erpetoichthys calabaricus TaxID=27687 RepID=A0A8C4T4W9_ERPCA
MFPNLLERFEQLKEKYCRQLLERGEFNCRPIWISLPDGKKVEGMSWKTSPLDLVTQFSLAKTALVARVNGEFWDLTRPLEENGELQVFGFDSTEGKAVGVFDILGPRGIHFFVSCCVPFFVRLLANNIWCNSLLQRIC